MIKRAYMDIETTGLSKKRADITVIGMAIEEEVEQELKVYQLVGEEVSSEALSEALKGVKCLYTYNGKRFDLPFIKYKLNFDIENLYTHVDLMYFCWRKNLKGGLKRVEKHLGIPRELPDVDGFDAVRWWFRYVDDGDETALDLLLKYNGEDVANLKKLRERLRVY